jgi:hypothetical protein
MEFCDCSDVAQNFRVMVQWSRLLQGVFIFNIFISVFTYDLIFWVSGTESESIFLITGRVKGNNRWCKEIHVFQATFSRSNGSNVPPKNKYKEVGTNTGMHIHS